MQCKGHFVYMEKTAQRCMKIVLSFFLSILHSVKPYCMLPCVLQKKSTLCMYCLYNVIT